MLAQAAQRYPVVLDTFAEASSALGYDLWALVSEGPEDQLTLTEFTQPAILTASVALSRCWHEEGGRPQSSLRVIVWESIPRSLSPGLCRY